MRLRPRWIVTTLVIWSVVVAMILLGRWQLDVSNSKHFNLQNFGYALQWWAFSAFALFMWGRLVRDAVRPPDATPSTGGELVRSNRGGQIVPVGPVNLVSPATTAGSEPVVYRGYVIPNSATNPARSEDDPYHASYNDYLWQLGIADKDK